MNPIKILRNLLLKDWLIAVWILGVYFLTNRYIYGWDDQHLEIPLLKHLIDPTLYQGDYYVESLTKNFTSFLYPILSRLISVDQIPAVYLGLFIVSRYFLFYWWFKLWHLIAVRSQLGTGNDRNTKLIAAACVLFAIVMGRTEEFLYRTFSHQEFTLAIIFAGVYFFFKDRYFLAAFLFGLSANFHALYSLFPMIYLGSYLLFFHPQRNRELFLKTGCLFAVSCLPFLIWTFSKALQSKAGLSPDIFDGWVNLYLLACPQNFPFAALPVSQVLSRLPIFLKEILPFLVLVSLYTYNFYANDHFRQDRRIHAISLTAVILIGVCFYFAYVVPNRFMLDLNLIRNEQFLRFFLLGYLVISAVRMIQIKSLFWAVYAGLILVLSFRQDLIGAAPFNALVAIMIALKTRSPHWAKTRPWMYGLVVFFAVAAFLQGLNVPWADFQKFKWTNSIWLVFVPILYGLLAGLTRQVKRARIILLLLPIVLMIAHYISYHYQYVQVTTQGGGFWQLQRNWEDMQRHVKVLTPKNALIFVPYNMEMCGFRIQSERKILVSYRDCGIVGFDYRAAKEWQSRIKDVEGFKVFTDPQSIGSAIIHALGKYKVDYIVFMKYYAPSDNAVVKKMYENEVFALYQVMVPRS